MSKTFRLNFALKKGKYSCKIGPNNISSKETYSLISFRSINGTFDSVDIKSSIIFLTMSILSIVPPPASAPSSPLISETTSCSCLMHLGPVLQCIDRHHRTARYSTGVPTRWFTLFVGVGLTAAILRKVEVAMCFPRARMISTRVYRYEKSASVRDEIVVVLSQYEMVAYGELESSWRSVR